MTIEVFYLENDNVRKIRCQKWGLVTTRKGTDFVAMGAFDSVVFPYESLLLISGTKQNWESSIDKCRNP